MKTTCTQNLRAAALIGAVAFTTTVTQAADPLPSWNDGKARQSIVDFVAMVTKPGSPDFVPVAERIATFDNDGCLWAEQPMYSQFITPTPSASGPTTASRPSANSTKDSTKPGPTVGLSRA